MQTDTLDAETTKQGISIEELSDLLERIYESCFQYLTVDYMLQNDRRGSNAIKHIVRSLVHRDLDVSYQNIASAEALLSINGHTDASKVKYSKRKFMKIIKDKQIVDQKIIDTVNGMIDAYTL